MIKNISNPPEAVIDELITKKELSRRLKVCVRKIELMVNAGEVPVIRIGASVRFSWVAVMQALESQQSVANH